MVVAAEAPHVGQQAEHAQLAHAANPGRGIDASAFYQSTYDCCSLARAQLSSGFSVHTKKSLVKPIPVASRHFCVYNGW